MIGHLFLQHVCTEDLLFPAGAVLGAAQSSMARTHSSVGDSHPLRNCANADNECTSVSAGFRKCHNVHDLQEHVTGI